MKKRGQREHSDELSEGVRTLGPNDVMVYVKLKSNSEVGKFKSNGDELNKSFMSLVSIGNMKPQIVIGIKLEQPDSHSPHEPLWEV